MGAFGKQAVKLRLDRLSAVYIAASVFCVEPLAQMRESTALRRRCIQREQLSRKGLHYGAHHVDRADFRFAEHYDDRSEIRSYLNELLGLELTQCFANHCPRYAVSLA